MSADEPIRLEPLGPDRLDEIEAFWRAASPLHPVTRAMLRGRLFDHPGADPELSLAARDSGGRLLGLASGVCIQEHFRFAGVRWLALDPALDALTDGRRIAGPLLDELCRRLAARGVEKARMLATPPYYFRPGIDTRETGLIACLLGLGWVHEATHFNMTADLANAECANTGSADVSSASQLPPAFDIGHLTLDIPHSSIYEVRRALPSDRPAFEKYMNEAWNASWRDESLQAFAADPATLFLALKDGEIVGFAAYEVSQCVGGFGPTGVSPAHRGAALGQRLLWACLDALRQAGRPVCEIGWVGPVPFYHRACGASLGPVYWMLAKALK